jgi:hypothetical protein
VRFHIRRSVYVAITRRHGPGAETQSCMAEPVWAEWSTIWFGARRADSGGGGGDPKAVPPKGGNAKPAERRRAPSGGAGRQVTWTPQAIDGSSRPGGNPSGHGGQAAGHSWSPHRGGEPGQLFRGGECREDCAGRPARRRPAPRRTDRMPASRTTLDPTTASPSAASPSAPTPAATPARNVRSHPSLFVL